MGKDVRRVVRFAWLLPALAAFAPPPVSSQLILLDQIEPPAQTMQFFAADSGCVLQPGPPGSLDIEDVFSLAEDFVVTSPVRATVVEFHGAYSLPAAPSDPTPFVFRILSDAAGLPGALVAQPGATVTQTLLSSTASFSLYEFTAWLEPVALGPGTYWLEIYEADDSVADCFRWRSGPLDAARGRDGFAESLTAPGSVWARPPVSASNLSLGIAGFPAGLVEVPSLGALGLVALTALLAAAAILWLRQAS